MTNRGSIPSSSLQDHEDLSIPVPTLRGLLCSGVMHNLRHVPAGPLHAPPMNTNGPARPLSEILHDVLNVLDDAADDFL